jgi:hypothetical protein
MAEKKHGHKFSKESNTRSRRLSDSTEDAIATCWAAGGSISLGRKIFLDIVKADLQSLAQVDAEELKLPARPLSTT